MRCLVLLLWPCVFISQVVKAGRTTDSLPVSKGSIVIQYDEQHPCNVFIPSQALGAGIDGHEKGDNDKMLSAENIRRMQSSGLSSLTYRLRTELGGEVWHWNPTGQWSDKEHHQGYWISDSNSKVPIQYSYGYRLPRRGNTIDQANDDGYSRIDDGDTASYWKSNPYLDHYYTHDPDSLHPQWLVIDLGKKQPVNFLHIKWGDPYAMRFRIEYSTQDDNAFFNPYSPHMWQTILPVSSTGMDQHDVRLQLFQKAVRLRYIRIVCYESSHTALSKDDPRDRMGYAVKEVELGWRKVNGDFKDHIHHYPDRYHQTIIFVSSTDPWHRESDKDILTEQPGIDFIFHSGLDNHQPVLFPSGLAYDVPENAVNLSLYLKSRSYSIKGLELGEEPDGQWMAPADFGSLYFQFARQIKKACPLLPLGGPSFQTIATFTDTSQVFTEKQWIRQFLEYLREKNSGQYFEFFSFEWYPFDDVCNPSPPQLLKAPYMLADALKGLRPGILPSSMPVYITEFGYSVLATDKENKIEGALLDADIAAKFLELGGNTAYLYGYEPNQVIKENPCNWGNMMLFTMDDEGKIVYPTSLYYSALLYANCWTRPDDGPVSMYKALPQWIAGKKIKSVTAYAIRLGNGKWSVMILNKDPREYRKVSILVNNKSTRVTRPLALPAEMYQWSPQQYIWKSDGSKSKPVRNHDPAHQVLKENGPFLLPPYSITVIRQQ